MLTAKNVLDSIEDRRRFDDARNRANPFEGVRKEFFINRAVRRRRSNPNCARRTHRAEPHAATHPFAIALLLLLLLTRPSRPRTPNTHGAQAAKMAAMDSAFGWIFSYPDAADPAATGNSLAPEAPFYPAPRPAPSLLAFADVAAGPGGFSEYLLWRRGASALGIGFTLRGTHDFTLSRFHYRSLPELLHAYYGPKDDGDLYVSSNIRALQALTDRQTDGQRLHVVMGDGGFDVSGAENIQEVLNKQLLLTQVMLCPIPLHTLSRVAHTMLSHGAHLHHSCVPPHAAAPPPPPAATAVCVRARDAAVGRPLRVQGLRPLHALLGRAPLHHAPLLRERLRVRRRKAPTATATARLPTCIAAATAPHSACLATRRAWQLARTPAASPESPSPPRRILASSLAPRRRRPWPWQVQAGGVAPRQLRAVRRLQKPARTKRRRRLRPPSRRQRPSQRPEAQLEERGRAGARDGRRAPDAARAAAAAAVWTVRRRHRRRRRRRRTHRMASHESAPLRIACRSPFTSAGTWSAPTTSSGGCRRRRCAVWWPCTATRANASATTASRARPASTRGRRMVKRGLLGGGLQAWRRMATEEWPGRLGGDGHSWPPLGGTAGHRWLFGMCI